MQTLRRRFGHRFVGLWSLWAVLGIATPVLGEESTSSSPLEWRAVVITPSEPKPDQLCQLSIEVENRGEHAVSRFVFAVDIDGQEQTVYRDRLFLDPIPAGQRAQLSLFNFWSTEPSRPREAPERVTLQITLLSARWIQIDGGVEKDLGAVKGLPIQRTQTIELRPSP